MENQFGLWSAIGLETYFLVNNPASISGLSKWAIGITYVGLILLYIFWQLSLRYAYGQDKKWQHYYMHRAEGILEENPIRKEISFWKHQGEATHLIYTVVETGVTALFLVGSFFLLSGAHDNKNLNTQKQS